MKTIAFVLAMLVCSTCYAEPVPDFNRIVDAIYIVEGGTKTRVPYGILSVKCSSKAECRRICLNTVTNNYRRWLIFNPSANLPYLDFLADKYCPPSVDPVGNRNWKHNIKAILNK